MKCSNCGQDIVANSKFCSNCGEAISIKEDYIDDNLKMKSKKNKIKEVKKEIKEEMQAAGRGISALLSIAGWILSAFLIIGLFTGTLGNVIDNLFLKPYYVFEVKSIDSPTGIGTLKDFINSSFTDVEWDFERINDEKYVTVSGDDSGSRWKFYYIIKDGYITFETMTADGESVADYIDNKVDSLLNGDTEVLEEFEEEVEIPEDFGTYKANELGKEYYGSINMDKLEDKYDAQEVQEAALNAKFKGTSRKIGKSIDKYLDNVTYNTQFATLGADIAIKGYSRDSGQNIMINITVTNLGGVYLSGIRQGTNNTLIDMPTQLKMAENIFD